MIYLVTRHAGTINFVNNLGIKFDKVIEHLTDFNLMENDTVIGNLPIQMVCKLNENKVNYFHIEINIPASHRGTELTEQDMKKFGAKITAYKVTKPDLFIQDM